MKRFLALSGVLCLAVTVLLSADAPDDEFVRIYQIIVQADQFKESGQPKEALARYLEAQEGLKKMQVNFPSWNKKLIDYRASYLSERIEPLARQFPAVEMTRPVAPVAGATEPQPGMEPQVRMLHQELAKMQMEKTALEAKLKEALAARPKAVDPAELAKAQEHIKALQKERDVQKQSLDQQAQALTSTTKERDSLKKRLESEKSEIPALKADNEKLKKQLAEAGKQAGSLPRMEDLTKQLADAKTKINDESARADRLARENRRLAESGGKVADAGKADELKKEIAAAKASLKQEQARTADLQKENRKLEKLLNDPSVQLSSSPSQEAEIKSLKKERDDLQKKLKELEKKNK